RGRGRVAGPGGDVPEGLEGEQVGRLGGVLEDEARRGIDGHRPGTRLGVGALAGVDGSGGEAVFALHRPQRNGGAPGRIPWRRSQSSRRTRQTTSRAGSPVGLGSLLATWYPSRS